MNRLTENDIHLVVAIVMDILVFHVNPNLSEVERFERTSMLVQRYLNSIPVDKPAKKKAVKK